MTLLLAGFLLWIQPLVQNPPTWAESFHPQGARDLSIEEQNRLMLRARQGDLAALSEVCQAKEFDVYGTALWACKRAAEQGDPKALERVPLAQEAWDANSDDAACPSVEEVKKSQKEGFSTVQAGLGNIAAQRGLGWGYYLEGCGVSPNYEEAYFWWKVSLRAGFKHPKTMDEDDYAFWAMAAAKQLTKAQLAKVTARVRSWRPAPRRDLSKLISRSNGGDVTASVELWHLCDSGAIDVMQNHDEATKWLFKAARQGNLAAIREVGRRYATGDRVQRNLQKSLMWYKRAAAKNDREAQYYLGSLYERSSAAEAYFWLSLCTVEESKVAKACKARRKMIAPKLSRNERAAADRKLQSKLTSAEWGLLSQVGD